MEIRLYPQSPIFISFLLEVRMTHEELYNKLEEIREQKNTPIDEFYPSLGISKSTFHLWKRGAVPKSIEIFINIYNLLNT